MRNRLFMHSIKNDSVLGRLKFVAKNEDNQVYGKLIPDVMVNKEIQNFKAYQTYLAFSTGAITPKKARKETKAAIAPKKKGLFTADGNIIRDPDIALELGKSIKSDEEEKYRLSQQKAIGAMIRDTPNVSKKKTHDQSLKLKGMEMLSDAALLEADTRKAIKASRHAPRIQQDTRGSSEGADITPEVLDEPKGKSIDTNEGPGITLEVLESEKETIESGNTNEDLDDEEEMHDDEEEHVDDETQEDEYVHDDVEKHDDADKEIKNADIVDEGKVDEEMTDATLVNAEKTQEEKVKEKPDVPPSSSSLFVSSDYDVSEIQKIKLEHATKQQLPKHSAKPFDQAAKAKFYQNEILFKMTRDSKSYEKLPTHQALFDALMQSLILDEVDMKRAKAAELPTQKKR
ncbi:hypothetical protein Tco_0629708 [Tanacetum coccineum]|uniref:Ribosome biogenesis protein NOP53 n=1 Tax=Tanacetum coccineum TaxID=301880 RepID=A0ABQ4WTY3_9ASTR